MYHKLLLLLCYFQVLVSYDQGFDQNNNTVTSELEMDSSLVRSLEEYNVEPVVVECTKDHKKSVAKLHQMSSNFYCHYPRKVLIKLKSLSTGIAHIPAVFEVKRCQGVCHQHNSKCIPTQSRTLTIPVQEMKIVPSFITGKLMQPKCLEYKIEEHISCSCACLLTASDCNKNQIFDPNLCRCACQEDNAKYCEKQGKIWIGESCTCKCPEDVPRVCSTGLMFDHDHCRCQRQAEEATDEEDDHSAE